jgi:DNA mismatch repair protein MutS2
MTMATPKTSERASLQGNRNTFSLSYILLFMKPDVKDALEFPDLDTLSLLLGIKRSDAEKVVIRNNENVAGYKVRDVFCTKETRELEKEILVILSSYAATKNGREKVLTLTPSLDNEELQKRFNDFRECEKWRKLLGDERIALVREIIANAEIENMSFGKSPFIALRRRGLEAKLKEQYGDFVRVAVADSEAKAQELLDKENIILLIGEGEEEFDEPGIIAISSNELADICELYPEFVINSFTAKKKALEAVIRLLTEFKELRDSPLFNGIAVTDLEEVMKLLEEVEAEKRTGATNFDEVIHRREEELNREINRIMRSGGGAADFKGYLDEVLLSMTDELVLSGEDKDVLWESAYENLERGPPFEFSRGKIELVRRRYTRKIEERRYYKSRDVAKHLERQREAVSTALNKLFYFDFMLAISHFSRDFGLSLPEIGDGGLGVIMGRNLFLVDEELRGGGKVVPVSYSVGETNVGIFGATPHPVAILTGANSGGKTCLLIMLASSIILTELGLPVPAERAEMPLLPLYVYRRKMIKRTGSFEYSMRALSRIFMREGAKVVLIDELEALTEPGAMGRIMASVLNNLPKDTLTVMITHLIHELVPHISMKKVRVDGIESEGLDAAGNIIVDRQPMFNHIGSSTPELVIKKLLGRVRKEELKAVYEEILKVLEKERAEWG